MEQDVCRKCNYTIYYDGIVDYVCGCFPEKPSHIPKIVECGGIINV